MKILNAIFPSKNQRELKKFEPLVKKINDLEKEMQAMSDEELLENSLKLKKLRNPENDPQPVNSDQIMTRAFALAREASVRTLKLRPFDTQLMGAIVLQQGKIAEMKTGEGKTLVACLAAYLKALDGKGAHIVTVNDHLVTRDAEWMRPVYNKLGMTVGCITNSLSRDERKNAYECDVTYGTNNEFGFDYLRDNMVTQQESKVQRGHYFAIVDEVDSILIDEARTPLIISGASETNIEKYFLFNTLIPKLKKGEIDSEGKEISDTGDFILDKKEHRVTLTESGVKKVEELLNIENLYSPQNSDQLHHIQQALKAHYLYTKDVHYLVEDGMVHIVDEFTGRKMPGRRFSNGLHQALEAKENVEILSENQTIATTTLQNYFRLYQTLAGMTGTADTEAFEFKSIYGLDVIVIPTNKPVIRKDHSDLIYRTEKEKFNAIINLVKEKSVKLQPVLIGTASVEKSEILSQMLTKAALQHELLNAKQHTREAQIVEKAGQKGSITIATNMAGRGTDIKLGEGVKELGGLLIIGSERHEARRIDNQLRGRSGRQGDPGESIFFLSLDDNLMKRFYSERVKNLLSRLGMKDGEKIEHPWISKQLETAQAKVEGRNFEIRKYLLEYDDVINVQRSYIYNLRDKFLKMENLFEEIQHVIYESVEDVFDKLTKGTKKIEEHLLKGVTDWLSKDLIIPSPDSNNFVNANKNKSFSEFVSNTKSFLSKLYLAKREEYPSEIVSKVERFIVINTLDTLWKQHLHSIDILRDGISLRSYAEKKPLIEFKKEGFYLFEEMLINFREEILKTLFSVQIKKNEEFKSTKSPVLTGKSERREIFSPANFSSKQNAQPVAAQQTVKVATKPGRNDPCYCGSGKKYKHCHLKTD